MKNEELIQSFAYITPDMKNDPQAQMLNIVGSDSARIN